MALMVKCHELRSRMPEQAVLAGGSAASSGRPLLRQLQNHFVFSEDPAADRMSLNSRRIFGISHQSKAGRELGITAKAVETRISRARGKSLPAH